MNPPDYTNFIAGYDTVVVESVGIGQSEVELDSLVDMLVLVIPPGSGDGLQASKKVTFQQDLIDTVAVSRLTIILAIISQILVLRMPVNNRRCDDRLVFVIQGHS
jgi:hypothetical protein